MVFAMDKTECIYRDALAVSLNAETEVAVGSGVKDLIDVLHCTADYDEIIEVKTAMGIRDAIGQVRSYVHRRQLAIPDKQQKARVHLIVSNNRSRRVHELNRIDEHRSECDADGIEISIVNEVQHPQSYEIGGLKFRTTGEINAHLKQIRRDQAVVGYTCPQHQMFLDELLTAWRRRYPGRKDEVGVGAWMQMTHFDWVHQPTHSTDFSAETVAV